MAHTNSRTATATATAKRAITRPTARAHCISIADGKRRSVAKERSRQRHTAVMCLLLGLATLIVYAQVVRYPFVNYDDDVYVFNNAHVNTGLNWQNVRWALTGIAGANWHPLTWISHMLDFQLFGLNAGGHHGTSLLLHIVNVVLLFLLLFRVTGTPGRSLAVAALFALHPLNVESVAWVAERKNVLCTLFFLLVLGAYGWYARRPTLRRYLVVPLLFALGLASKPMVVTLPFVLLLLDFWPLKRISGWAVPPVVLPLPQMSFQQLVFEKLPLLLLSGASAVITIIAQRRGDAITSVSGWTISWRIENAIHSYAAYLWDAFLPRGLAPFYPGMILPLWLVALSAMFLLGVGWLVWKFRHGRPYLIAGCLWFLGTLVPVLGLVQVGSQSMADRYTYIPLIGISTAVVWGVAEAAERSELSPRWRMGIATSVFAGLSLLCWRQLGYWRNSLDLWTHTLQVTASNYVAEQNLAMALVSGGRDDEALPHFVNAKQITPNDALASLHIGINLEKLGFHREAIQQLDDVLHTTDEPAMVAAAYKGMGVAYAQMGDRGKARENFLRAIRLSPNGPAADDFYNLSLLELQEAVEKTSRLVAAHPTAQGYLQLAQILHEEHSLPDAQAAYEKALQLDPKLEEARQGLKNLKNNNQ
jgi:hypothetical protein